MDQFQKVELADGDVAVVEVQPSQFPPIRSKGQIWVRVGPRKGVANEQDEKILIEKRNSQALTFDALPCHRATIDDIDTHMFLSSYLPKAMPKERSGISYRHLDSTIPALTVLPMPE